MVQAFMGDPFLTLRCTQPQRSDRAQLAQLLRGGKFHVLYTLRRHFAANLQQICNTSATGCTAGHPLGCAPETHMRFAVHTPNTLLTLNKTE